jgi:serine/threonine protein kinase
MIGKTVSHYKIIEHIGGGGMGVVYKAEDTKLKRAVALKFLPPAFATDPTTKERFIHEAQAASALQHNNICAIHEIDETDDGQMYIVMDYYEGEILKLRIEEEKLKSEDAVNYAIQIAQGLHEAHQRGIIHRDIKPANVIITNKGEAKILDFGLAKFRGQTKITKTGSTVGTVAYMSPEQARGEEVDHRTDIWSLGVMLYEMVTGELPFKGDYDQAIIYSILNTNPESIQLLAPKTPIKLTRITNRLMDKNKVERYQTCNEFIDDLKKLGGTYHIHLGKVNTERIGFGRLMIKSKTKKRIIIGTLLILSICTAYIGFEILYPSKGKTEPKLEDTEVKTKVTYGGDVLSVAILPFTNFNAPENVENLIYDNMQIQFLDTSILKIMPFEIVDKFVLGSVIEELSLNKSQLINTKDVIEIGKALNVDALIIGSISSAVSNTFGIDLRVVDTELGAILAAQNVYLKSININVVDSTLKKLIIKIIDDIPHVVGNIVGVDDNKYFDAGIVDGLKRGRRCIIYRLGEPIRMPDTGMIVGQETDIIAEVIITNLIKDSSFFRIVRKASKDSIVVGDKFVTK